MKAKIIDFGLPSYNLYTVEIQSHNLENDSARGELNTDKNMIKIAHKIAAQKDISVYYAMSMLEELSDVWGKDHALEYGNYLGSGIEISCNEYAKQCGLKVLS